MLSAAMRRGGGVSPKSRRKINFTPIRSVLTLPLKNPGFRRGLSPRFDGVALPGGVGGDAVTAHDQRAGADGAGFTNERGG